MPHPHIPLEEQILTAFKRALSEGRMDVAEHLLKALEALDPHPMPGSLVADAYGAIAGMAKRPRRAR